jgi:hypothetical protein
VTQHHEMRRIWEKGEKNKTLVSWCILSK